MRMPSRGLCRVLAAVALAALAACARPSRVEFPSLPQAGPAMQLVGELTRPRGSGPFPAVVMLWGCEMDRSVARHVQEWVKRFQSWGYATLLVDSFTPRGVEENCSALKVRPRMRAYDAWAALSYLQDLDFIDAERVAVAGWSQGGWSATFAVDRAIRPGGAQPFKAAVAFYPVCQEIAQLETPLLLLGGQEDQSLNSRDWPGLQARLQTPSGPEFRFTLYPGVYHAFDFKGLQSTDPALRYDAQAAADAVDKVKEFLTRHLTTD